MSATFAWIPEAPNHPGLYANLNDRGKGKLVLEPPKGTFNIENARRFPSKDQCQEWCDANPIPKFVPVEHGFYGGFDVHTTS